MGDWQPALATRPGKAVDLALHHRRSGGPVYSDITPGFARPAGATTNPANGHAHPADANQR
jgi:hypothetical protein